MTPTRKKRLKRQRRAWTLVNNMLGSIAGWEEEFDRNTCDMMHGVPRMFIEIDIARSHKTILDRAATAQQIADRMGYPHA